MKGPTTPDDASSVGDASSAGDASSVGGDRTDRTGRTDLERVIRARRMVRTFADGQIDPGEIDAILDLARRAPAAGNTSAIEFLVLDTPEAVARYWGAAMSDEIRRTFRWQSLLTAPALIVLITRPAAYVERYAESDKARPGLGRHLHAWTQPFWWIDAGMVAQNLLLVATDRHWGASLFGLFDHEEAVKAEFGVPVDRRLVCTVALGEPSDEDPPGRSAGRRRPRLDEVVHRSDWGQSDA